MLWRIKWLGGGILAVILGWAIPVAAQTSVKVHKELIEVSPPDKSGIVSVTGQDHALTCSSPPTSFYIENLTTRVRIPITYRSEGNFSTRIKAATGQQVRVLARISGGRQSYGTFNVPASPSTAPLLDSHSSMQLYHPDLTTLGHVLHTVETDPNAPPQPDMAIIITCLDPRTGRVLAVRSIMTHTGLNLPLTPDSPQTDTVSKQPEKNLTPITSLADRLSLAILKELAQAHPTAMIQPTESPGPQKTHN